MNSVWAATPIYLKSQPGIVLQSEIEMNHLQFKLFSSTIDSAHIQHQHYAQLFLEHPIYGANIILHSAEVKYDSINELLNSAVVTGRIYKNIQQDLENQIPQDEKIILKKILSPHISHPSSQKIIFIDKNNHAHWAYIISYSAAYNSRPTLIVDAINLSIYQQWNSVQTLQSIDVAGLGGNKKIGQHIFEGIKDTLPKLTMQRDEAQKICYIKNENVTVYDLHDDVENPKLAQFSCPATDPQHENMYWDGSYDAMNDAYSQNNDALYIGRIIIDMYQTWYHLAVLKADPVSSNEKLLPLVMNTHIPNADGAFFLPSNMQMYFGDGQTIFYPLVSLDVGAHEISHGFTQQRSGLNVYYQPGSINEAFSDMAAKAAEYFSTGKNSWDIGADIMREGEAFRYMDDPRKDCEGRIGQACSIDNIDSYSESVDEHYACGIFNKAFYLIASSPDWNTKKAFDVMLQANIAYWRPDTDFKMAVNCVLKATEDLHYKEDAVIHAFAEVGITGVHAYDCY